MNFEILRNLGKKVEPYLYPLEEKKESMDSGHVARGGEGTPGRRWPQTRLTTTLEGGRDGRTEEGREGEQTAPPSSSSSSSSTDSDADDACSAPIFAAATKAHFSIRKMSRKIKACTRTTHLSDSVITFAFYIMQLVTV